MTKVGIITHYYGSSNYGGVLQAYALCNFINAIGFEAEQICYNKKDTVTVKRRIGSLLRIMKKALHPRVCYYMLKRRKAFVNFRTNIIRHSENVYTESNFFLFLRVLRCFSSPGSPRMTMYSSYDT